MAGPRMQKDILLRMRDLVEQAINEKSHYYTASVLMDAMAAIERLREENLALDAEIDLRGGALLDAAE